MSIKAQKREELSQENQMLEQSSMLLETGWNPEAASVQSGFKQMHNLLVNGMRLVEVGKLLVIGIPALVEGRYVTLHIADLIFMDLHLMLI